MVVSGAVGFLERCGRSWSEWILLHHMSVVIDTTGSFYWLTKNNLLKSTSTDKYGTSMIELGHFYRDLFKRLRENNVHIRIVFEGGRKSDRSGEIVSKRRHLEGSASANLRRLNRGDIHNMDNLPDLAINCLKEIVRELGFGPDQIYQAESEIYPVVVHLARKYNCPVLTHHTDFIFQDVPAGFVRLDMVQFPADIKKPIGCSLYKHSKMLQSFNLTPEHSGALSCLAILLRDDFAETYYNPINRILNLQRAGQLKVGPNVRFARVKTRRLEYVLKNWPRNSLTSSESVRAALVSQPQSVPHLTRDFDALRECYSVYSPFEGSELARAFSAGMDQSINLHEALTKRESSAEFLTNAILTNYNRTGIEDTKTFRSIFSLQDRAKQYLLNRLRASELNLYDRRRDQMEYRIIMPINQQQNRLDCETHFALFHFDERKLTSIANKLKHSIQIDDEHSNRLSLLLMLASFALRLVPRENLSNNLEDLSAPPSHPSSGSLASEQHQLVMVLKHYSHPDTKVKFFTAIANSYVYLQFRTNQGDQSQQEIPADIRVARDKVEKISQEAPGVHVGANENYYRNKHLVEALNSVLHAYKELNSLYNFPAPNILVNRYYDAVVLYKIMVRFSKNVQGFLLKLDPEIMNEL